VRANLNPVLEIEGLLRTMYDPRSTLTQQVSRELEGHFGDKVYRTIIPRNVRLAEAPSYGKPVIAFDRSSKGAQAYLLLAQEILDRQAGSAVVTAALALEWGHETERTGPWPRRPAGGQRRSEPGQQRTLPVGASSRASTSRARAWTALRSKNWRPRSGCRADAADSRTAGQRRPLRDHCRRAALASGADGRTDRSVDPDPGHSGRAALAMALIENIQRENLNPLEEALGLQRLIDEFSMTHQQAADAVGRSRPAASNLLRLLQLARRRRNS
jgi:hypothetical protein